MNIGDVKGAPTWQLRSLINELTNGPSSIFNDDNDTKILKAAQAEVTRRDKAKERVASKKK